MKNVIKLIFILLLSIDVIADEDMSDIAKNLNLYAGTKASIQWERIFSSERRLKRYKLDEIDTNKLIRLKSYLIKHAADSKQPVVPGL